MQPLAWHQRRWDDGRTLLRTPLAEPLEAVFGFPHYQMHRADLLAALAAAVPAERLHLGHRLTGVTDHGDRVEARVRQRRPRSRSTCWSAPTASTPSCAASLFGPTSPRFTGCVAYRGLVPAERLRDLELEVTAQVWMGPGRHFVHYFVSGGASSTSSRSSSRTRGPRESWTDRGEVADALAAFEGWHPQVRTILGAVDETFIWALFDRAAARALVGRARDAARRRLPPDAAVHGPGRRPGDRGRRDAGRLPGRCGR